MGCVGILGTDVQLPTRDGKASPWNHPFWVVGKKAWVEARDLKSGDRVLLSSGKEVAISGIRSYNVDATKVYNFEVADNHTYFVGEDGVLVHNYDVLKNVHDGLRDLGNDHYDSFYATNDPILKLYHSLGIGIYGTADLVLPSSDVEAGKDILTLGPAARPIGLVTEVGANVLKSKLVKQGVEKRTKTITTKLQSYVNQAARKVDDLGDAAFTPKQLRAIQRNPNLAPMYRGNRIDVKARELMKNDPFRPPLKSNYTNGPDFVDPTTGRWWDMTTPNSWPAHEKKYGLGGTFLNTQ